jgi:predicted enzyme related to lactoylglutathione lyase
MPKAARVLPHESLRARADVLHRVMFAVDDIDDTVARLQAHGAELLGEVAQYQSTYRLCYLRGPARIIVALAEQIG